MRFLMFVCRDTEPIEPSTGPVPDVEDWVKEMDGRGVRITGDPVRPQAEARTVRVRGGSTVVTDGPFVETKEVLAGFDLLECRDMAEAIEVAAGHPMAYEGVIELRPLVDFS
jgi:hypothetical protein